MWLRFMISGGLALVVVALAACGGEAAPDVDPSREFPTAAVAAWLDAVADDDVPVIGEYVDPRSLAIVVAVENGLDVDQTVAVLEGGLPEDVAAGYWSSFADDFAVFSGRPIRTLRVGGSELLSIGDVEFATVEISAGEEGTGSILTRRDSEEGWRVDMTGTVGPGFIGPIRSAFAALPDGDAGDTVRRAFTEVVAPALQAAIELDPSGIFVPEAGRLLADIEAASG